MNTLNIQLLKNEKATKPMRNILGINNIPRITNKKLFEHDTKRFEELNFAHIRFHDAPIENYGQQIIDIHRIFPLFHLDETKEENYIFAQTDDYLRYLEKSDAEIDFRLGETEEGYICRFEKFVNSVRKDFEKSNLPIFTFQLNRQIIKATNENLDNGYDAIREAQRIAAKKIPNVYVLPAIDATIMSDFIHSSKASNMMLGERLASSVLYNIYGIGMNISAPDIFSAKLNDEKTVVLEFANVVGFLDAFNVGYDKLPFTVEDDKGRNEITDYRLKQNIIELILKRPCVGNVFVSGQSGTDPKNIIIDFYTQLPMLCFKKFTVL